MIAFLSQLLSSRDFIPHGQSYLWRPEIVSMHVISDAVIALSYWSIPFSLLYILRRRPDVPVRWLVGLFVVFIAACGVTHLMEVITVWHPLFVTSGLIKAFTAVVSAITAITLIPVLPQIVNLRSPQELELLNQKLAREVEDRMAIEAELRRSHATLEAIVRASPLSILALDREGRVTLWNPAAEAMFGWSKSEIIGQRVPHVPETEREEFQRVLQQEFQGETFRELETRRRTKSGEMIDAAVWTAPLRIDGDIVGGLHIVSDITERKKLERQRAEIAEMLETHVAERTAELKKANRELTQRNQENELFVYSVSHDLRSPLVNLQGFSEELRRSCDQVHEAVSDPRVPDDIRKQIVSTLSGDVEEAITYIQRAVKNLSDILMSLLKLSRASRAECNPEAIDMSQLVASVIRSQEAEIRRKGGTVVNKVESFAWADRTAIQQVFAQVLDNGLKYSHPNKAPYIEIGEIPHPSDDDSQVEETRSITYYVRDNGVGIPAEHQPKVFQAFQRLYPQATTGEGIGLALARRLLERNGGRMWLESEAGSGSTFYISLPARPANERSEASE